MSARNIKTIRGVAAISLASVLWSVGYLIRKHVSAELGPFTVTFTEALAGSLLAMAFYRITPKKALAAAKKGGWPAAAIAILGVTVANSALVFAFRTIDLGVASILEKTQPIFTVILAPFFLKEKLSPLSLCFGALGIVGAIEVIPFSESAGGHLSLDWQAAVGVMAVVFAALMWSFAGMLGRKLAIADLGSVNISLLRAGAGAITVLPLMLVFEMPTLSGFAAHGMAYALAALNGFLDTVICYVLYYYGLRFVGATVTSIIEVITPVGAVLLGVAVLGESLTGLQSAGAVIVLASVTLLVWNEMRTHSRREQEDIIREMKP